MPRRRFVRSKEPTETLRLAINALFARILASDKSEFELVSSLTADERAYIHERASDAGFKSKSRGKGSKRFLTIYKREGSTIVQKDAMLQLSAPNRQMLENVVNKYPLTHRERQDLIPATERDRNQSIEATPMKFGKSITTRPPQVPLAAKSTPDMENWRKTLPVFRKRAEIMETIANNSVTLIQGETGCGKTTQVPQYILEDAREQKIPCRIIVTEPRRLACTSLCDRLSAERNEQPGSVVGYQIRLECKFSPETVLTFCTPGIMITTLMSEATVSNITHVIIDEIHERDRFCDFLLICLRDLRIRYPQLKIILMSASVNTGLFEKYFNCPVVTVPGRSYAVQEYYLNDVLKITKYMTPKMAQYQQAAKKEDGGGGGKVEVEVPSLLLSDAVNAAEMDDYLDKAFNNGDIDSLMQFIHILFTENYPIDFKHSTTGMTALMAASARNLSDTVHMLLRFGADPNVRTRNGMTAVDIAKMAQANDAVVILESCSTKPPVNGPSTVSTEDQLLIDAYTSCVGENFIDCDLIVKLIVYIHRNKPPGAILVFLPGYEDILKVRDRFRSEEQQIGGGLRARLYLLHSQFRNDMKTVFKPPPDRSRKIILATNIAETSLTINDVVYVIDTGKVKEKSFDAINNICGLEISWISKSCAEQRKGRAGRCQAGICYRLYSKQCLNSFTQYSTPEILRSSNMDLCLNAKLFVQFNTNTTIAEFLGKAVEPPIQKVTRDSVQLLKTIDALNACEELTVLGSCLGQLTTEPMLGKILLYSLMLKCLDPILTIVSCLDYRDPFIIPQSADDRKKLKKIRQKLAERTYSDHFVLLRLFQGWQQAQANRTDRAYCEDHFISSSTMEMIQSTRTQLLNQLRSLGFLRKQTGDIRELNSNSDSWPIVKAAICAGMYPNIARLDRDQQVLRTRKECKVSFHCSCVLMYDCPNGFMSLPTDWIVYNELFKVGKYSHFKTCSIVSPLTVALVSGSAKLSVDSFHDDAIRPEFVDPDSDSEADEDISNLTTKGSVCIDEWIEFITNPSEANSLSLLRMKLNVIFMRKLSACLYPQKVTATSLQADDAVIKEVVALINNAERELSMAQPLGVGQRPRNIDDHVSNAVGNMHINNGRRWQRGDSADVSENVKYFSIRTPSPKALESAFLRSNWQFSQPTERKLLTVLRDEGRDLILFFSAYQTMMLHGVARIKASHPVDPGQPWPLQWLKKHAVAVNAAKNICVGNSDLRRYDFKKDGQEIPEQLGRALLRLWDQPLLGQRPPFPDEGFRGMRPWQYMPRHM